MSSLLLVGALTARADLAFGTSDTPSQRAGQAAAFADLVSANGGGLSALPAQWLLTSRALCDPLGAAGAAAASVEPESEEPAVLPPTPDSALLAMSGLLSLGAIQLGRNVRKLHLGTLPEWYHDGGPTQVGHSTPLDLDLGFNLSALPVCVFAVPVGAKDPVLYGARWLDAARWAPQSWPTTHSARGPPNVS